MNYFKVENSADHVDIYIYGVIGYEVDEATILEQIKDIDNKPINLYINSGGGGVFVGWAMMSILGRLDNHITSHIDGLCASMATGIAMVANKVVMNENALFMVHNASSGAWGNSSDLRKKADMLDKIDNQLISNYAQKTNLNEDEVRVLVDFETWMTAQEALDYGFIDEISQLKKDNDTDNSCKENCDYLEDNPMNYKNIPIERLRQLKNEYENSHNEKLFSLAQSQVKIERHKANNFNI
jgi:ATP-dependent Clp protease protease subunit